MLKQPCNLFFSFLSKYITAIKNYYCRILSLQLSLRPIMISLLNVIVERQSFLTKENIFKVFSICQEKISSEASLFCQTLSLLKVL